MDNSVGFLYNASEVLRRAYRTQESLVRYWAKQAVDLCRDIEDESLEEYAEPVRAASQALLHDRRIIALGGEKCGKSTMLAALAGTAAIARCPMPAEQPYICWRSICRDGDATNSRFLPLSYLDGLELVDTAACRGPVADTCRTLLQGADVILAVVDSRSPIESPVWDLLPELAPTQLSGCLLVVSFTDQLGAEASLRLKDTLRELCRNKLGTELPIYPVLPSSESSISVFRARVQETMQTSQVLRGAIRCLAERASDLVDKQSRILLTRHSASQTDNSFLAGIDQEIDNFLSRQMMGLSTHQTNLSNAIMNVLPPLLQMVHASFGRTLSPTTLLRLEYMGADTDRALYHQIEDKVQHMQLEADQQFVMSCAGHWRSVRPRMKKTLECEIGEFPGEDLEAELAELRKRLCRDLYEPFSSTGLRHRFFRLFIAQAGWMRACIIFICFLLVAAGGLGYMGQDMLGICCVATAVLVWLLGSMGQHFAYKHICHNITSITLELQEDMEATMRTVLERLIISRVAAYRRLYTKPRQKVARQDAMLQPLQARQKEIRIQLRSILPRI